MNEKRIYQISLALPIIFPAICLLVTPHNLHTSPQSIGTILMIFIFSGFVGGIPYVILATSILIWMRNKDLSQIRKALLLSPLLLIPVFTVCMIIYNFVFLNESPPDSAAQIYLMYFLMFSAYILFVGYFYVSITFGVARLFRRKSFSNTVDDQPPEIANEI